MQTDQLINELVADADPVNRLRPPLIRATLWSGLALALIGLFGWAYGLRPDLMLKLGEPLYLDQTLGALLTGLVSAVAVFYLSLPDRSPWLLLAPVPPLMFWVASLGTGCFMDWIAYGSDGLEVGNSAVCFVLIVATSIVPAGILYLMLRRTRPFRPVAATLMGSLAVASLAAFGLRFFHSLDASMMVLVWQFGSVLIVVAVASCLGSRPWPSDNLDTFMARRGAR